mgnify:FL=1
MPGYQLIHVQYSGGKDYVGGKDSIPTATVQMKKPDGSEVTEAAVGNGPVDAVFKAIQRALGIRVELLEFSVSAISSGSEAIGKVVVQIKDDGAEHEGSALGTDIIVASAEAFVDALNAAFEVAVVAHTV